MLWLTAHINQRRLQLHLLQICHGPLGGRRSRFVDRRIRRVRKQAHVRLVQLDLNTAPLPPKVLIVFLVAIACINLLNGSCCLVLLAEVEGIEEKLLLLIVRQDPIGDDLRLRRHVVARLRRHFNFQELGLVLLILIRFSAILRPVATVVLHYANGSGLNSHVGHRAADVALVLHSSLLAEPLLACGRSDICKRPQLSVSLVIGPVEERRDPLLRFGNGHFLDYPVLLNYDNIVNKF